MARQQTRRPQLVRIAVVLGLVARQRHQPGFGLRRNRRLLARSGSVIKCHQRPLDAALDRLMMHANPLSDGKKRWVFAISQKHLARCTRLASSVRDRESTINRATSSSVIATSKACRHVLMMSFLVHLFSNKESTNIFPVPCLLASAMPVSWNPSSSILQITHRRAAPLIGAPA